MTFRKVEILLIPVFVILLFTSGCLNYSFGDPEYNGSELNINIENNGDARYSTVQITVFSLEDFRQKEYAKYVETVYLKSGNNVHSVKTQLKKGSYKMYLYVLEDGKRASAEIRDITV